jgi:hypothetical protein
VLVHGLGVGFKAIRLLEIIESRVLMRKGQVLRIHHLVGSAGSHMDCRFVLQILPSYAVSRLVLCTLAHSR